VLIPLRTSDLHVVPAMGRECEFIERNYAETVRLPEDWKAGVFDVVDVVCMGV
jgi:hypothetical protein